MKYFNTLVAVAMLVATAFGSAGCSDSDNGGETPTPGPGPSTLQLSADATAVKVGESVKFTLLKGEEDVTAQARFYDVATGKDVASPFVPAESDVYRIAAEYDGQKTDPVQVTAIGTYEGADNFFRRVLLFKFTATTCINCPSMTIALSQLDRILPNRVSVMALHVADEFATRDSGFLSSDFHIKATPWGRLDYHVELTGPSQVTSSMLMAQSIETEMKDYPAASGIALETWVEEGQLYVKSQLRFAKDDNYLLCCAVVEDGLHAPAGYEPDGIYDHVQRDFATSRYGDKLGDRKAGEQYPCLHVFQVDKKWNLDKCHVMVYVLRKDKAQNVYVDNIVEGAVGKKVDFAYEAA